MPKANAISFLKQDHVLVKSLFEELSATSDRGVKKRQELLSRIELELKVHTRIEEEIFYPAFRDAAQKKKEDLKLFFEAMEEHHVVDLVLPDVKRADVATPSFLARAKVLRELVENHIDEEEKQMFPRARELFQREALEELAHQLETRKQELLEHKDELLGMDGGKEKEEGQEEQGAREEPSRARKSAHEATPNAV